MFSFGNPDVSQHGSIIIIRNIRTKILMNDISRIWKTQRINSNMFEDIGRSAIKFEAFFALEFYYILDSIIYNRRVISNVRVLRAIQRQLETNTWLKALNAPVAPRIDLKRLNDLTLTLFPYQLDFLEKYDKQTQRYCLNGMLLGTLPGSGKTATTLALTHALSAERIIVICPKTAVERVWEQNIQTLFKTKQSYWYSYSGKKYANERFAIFHYEAINKAMDIIDELRNPKIAVILDESHNLTEMTSLRTQLFIELCQKLNSKDTILASGTPIKAITSEIIPLFHVIDPLFNDNVATRFRAIYRGDANRATEILTHRIDQVSFKIEKEELKLTAPIFRNLPIAIPNGNEYTLAFIGNDLADYAKKQIEFYTKQRPANEKAFYELLDKAEQIILSKNQPRSEYKKAIEQNAKYHTLLEQVIFCDKRNKLRDARDAIVFCNSYEKNVIMAVLTLKDDRVSFKELKTLVKYMRLKVRGECLGRVLGRKRIEAHMAMVPYIDFDTILNSTEKKTVVFTSYVEVVDKANEILLSQGNFPVVVYGAVNKNLANLIDQFERDSEKNPLIATYASLSTAVPLIMADTMVIVNSPFRNYIFEQAVSRIHRLGANTQTCIYLCFLDTGSDLNISSRNVDILKWSQDQVEKILGIDAVFKIEDLPNMAEIDEQVTSGLIPVIEELHIPDESLNKLEINSEKLLEITPLWVNWK
jgi:SNF2 family DNA or RNA helicase